MVRYACWLAAGLALISGCAREVRAQAPEEDGRLKVLVVTGGHGFDEAPFYAMFSDTDSVRYTHSKEGDSGAFLDAPGPWLFDAVVLYNMAGSLTPERREKFKALMDAGTGLVVLHHAIANYPDWPEYAEIIGAKYFLEPMSWNGADHPRSEYTHDVEMKIHVEDGDHPVTKGVGDFSLVDETYRKWLFLPGSRLLLTTDHPESNREIAWVREQGKSKVCFIQLGHGPQAFEDANYKRLMDQAIAWTAGV